MIAKQFLITGITMAVIAMTLSILFRIQLAYPDKTFPLLEVLLGRFAPVPDSDDDCCRPDICH